MRIPELVRSHASYLSPLFDEPDVVAQRFRIKLRGVDFDTVIGTGISGTLAAQLFARDIGINFAIVRKHGDGTHSVNDVEGIVGRRWVFVDDLIDSGETRYRVKEAMKAFCRRYNFESQYVGTYLYYYDSWAPYAQEENGNV